MGASDEILGSDEAASGAAAAGGGASADILQDQSPSARLGYAYQVGLSSTPDQAARVHDLSKQTGLAPDLVARNVDAVDKGLKNQSFDPTAFTAASPKTAAWMSDPVKAGIAQNGLSQMQQMEQAVNDHSWYSNFLGGFVRGAKGMVVDPLARLYQGAEIPGIKEADTSAYPSTPEGLAQVNPLTDVANLAILPASGVKSALKAIGAAGLVTALHADVLGQKVSDWLTSPKGDFGKWSGDPEFRNEYVNALFNIPAGIGASIMEQLPQLAGQSIAMHGAVSHEALQANIDHDSLTTLGKQFADSPLTKASSMAASDHAAAILKDTKLETSHINADDFKTLFQKEGLDPLKAATQLGVAKEYMDAAESSSDFQIPTAKILETMAGTPLYDKFIQHVKTDPAGATPAEAEQVQAEADAAQNDQKNMDSAALAAQSIREQALKAGVPQEQADSAAALWESRTRTRAERRGQEGVGPEELMAQWPVTIQREGQVPLEIAGPELNETALSPEDQASLDKFRTQQDIQARAQIGGASPIIDFVRNNGGMDFEKIKNAGDAADFTDMKQFGIFGGTQSPDRMLESAIEAKVVPPETTLADFKKTIADEGKSVQGLKDKFGQGSAKRGQAIYDRMRAEMRNVDKKLTPVKMKLRDAVPAPDELQQLRDKLAKAENRANAAETARKTSDLTGLPNKVAFKEDAASHKTTVAFDLDNFKSYNSILGHEAVDRDVLSKIGEILQKQQGTATDFKLYHLAGDEFAIGVNGDHARAEEIAQDTLTRLRSANIEAQGINEKTGEPVSVVFHGIGATHGIGENYKAADAAAGAESVRKRATGEKQDLRNTHGIPGNVEFRGPGETGGVQGQQGGGAQSDSGGMGGRTLDQKKLGSFTSTPEQSFITLMKKANASTILHESWHRFYFEMDQDAKYLKGLDPESLNPMQKNLLDDYDNVLKNVKAKSFDEMTGAQHEKLAKWGEEYLREGKSPSKEMQPIFDQFRGWLTNIYRHVGKLLQGQPGVNDEMRGIMDRMLASDDAIAEAQKQQGDQPMPGLDDPKYAQAFADAKATATRTLSDKMMAEMHKQRTAEYKAQRDEAFKESLSEVNKRPEYSVINALANGLDKEGNPLGEHIKLDKDAVVQTFGKERLASLPKEIFAEPGAEMKAPPDVAAVHFGYRSAEEMLNDLANKPRAEDLAGQMADARMELQHGDLLKDGQLPAEALKAVHNDKRARLLRMEFDYLAENEKPTLKALIRKVARRPISEEAARSASAYIVGTKEISNLRPDLYLRAENKMRRLAGDLLTKGDFTGAAQAKQREMLNHELYRSADAAKDMTARISKYMGKFDKLATQKRIGKAGEEYMGAIDFLRGQYGFAEPKGPEGRAQLAKVMDANERAGNPIMLSDSLLNNDAPKSTRNTQFKDLSDAYDGIRTLEHAANQQNVILKAFKDATIEDKARDLNASVTRIHGEGYGGDKGAEHDYDPGLLTRLNNARRQGVAWMLRPLAIIGEIDGHEANGAAYKMFWEPKQAAETAEAARQRTFREAEKNELYGQYSRTEKAQLFLRKIDVPEIKQSLTRERMIMMLANWGNEENRTALREGNGYTDTQMQAIFSHLEPRDLDTVHAMWKHVDSYWPDIKAQEFKLRGVAPEKVEAAPFEVKLADGSTHQMDGGYFPILFDRDRSPRQVDMGDIKSVGDMFGGDFARWMTKDGHTKERVGAGGAALRLNLDDFTRHVSSIIHDLSYRETLIDLHKMVNDPGIKSDIVRAVSKEKWNELNPWISRMAGRPGYDPMDSVAGWLRTNLTSSILAYRMSVGLKHAGSEFTTLHELGPQYAVKGLTSMVDLPHIRENLERMYDFSDYMKNRDDAGDREMHDFIRGRGILNKPGMMATLAENVIGGKVADKAALLDSWKKEAEMSYFVAVRQIDKLVSFATWSGTYAKAMDGGIPNIDAGDHMAAVSHANRNVQEIKGAGSPGDLPRILSGNDWQHLFTMFMTQRNVIFNQHAKSVQQGGAAMSKGAWRVASGSLLSALMLKWMIPSIWNKVVTKGLPKGEEDKKNTALEAAGYPLEGVPFASEAARYMLQKYGEGKDPEISIPPLKFVEEAAQTGHGLWAASFADGMSKEEMRSTADTAGAIFRLPGPLIFQALDYTNSWLNGSQHPSNPAAGVWRALVAGKE